MNYFKKLRLASGLTQGELAKKLGYSSPQFVSNWERGMCIFPANKIPKAANAFGVSRREIVEHMVYEYKEQLTEISGAK